MGDLYEYDRSSKPVWKKHVWKDRAARDFRLMPSPSCYIHNLNGDHSISLFLLTKVLNREKIMPKMKTNEFNLLLSYYEPKIYSLSLLSENKFQDGNLVERRLHKRKWKWIVHGKPKDHQLTSVLPALQDESNEKFISLFLTTSSGFVFEYRTNIYPGKATFFTLISTKRKSFCKENKHDKSN